LYEIDADMYISNWMLEVGPKIGMSSLFVYVYIGRKLICIALYRIIPTESKAIGAQSEQRFVSLGN
jgi:hypothetical protein